MMAMCDRSDLFTSMEQTPQFDASDTPRNRRESEMMAAQRNITVLFALGNLLIEIEAAKIVKVIDNRRCRAYAWNVPNSGDTVDIYRPPKQEMGRKLSLLRENSATRNSGKEPASVQAPIVMG